MWGAQRGRLAADSGQAKEAGRDQVITPWILITGTDEFSSNFIEFPSFLKGKDSFYSDFPNSQARLFPMGGNPAPQL